MVRARYNVEVGKTYGGFTVIEKIAGSRYPYKVACECGKELFKDARTLNNESSTRKCIDCSRKDRPMNERSLKPEGHSAATQLYLRYGEEARKRGYRFDISREQFVALTSQFCYYCASPPTSIYQKTNITSGAYKYNGIDRIDNRKGYVPGNIVTACKRCNQAKNDMTPTEFMEWIKAVYQMMPIWMVLTR